ncbi:unnamed protein product [Symbiodinium sp. CCMP2456]|nr:unnamed protein product [Symbiodinium sp. CCMP2456]
MAVTAETRHVAVVALTGEVVVQADVLALQTVAELKSTVARRRPRCAPCWQRLLLDGRELQDQEVLADTLPSDEPATLQLVVALSPWDLLLLRRPQSCSVEELRRRKLLGEANSLSAFCGPGDLERHSFAVAAAEALGRGQSSALVKRLFEERETALTSSEAEDLLYQLREDFARYTERLPNLRAALLDQVLRLLPEGDVPKSVRIRHSAQGEDQSGQTE